MWQRAIVEPNAGFSSEEYILWLVDYGHPVQGKPHNVRKLNREFARYSFGNVVKAGIACIMPAEEEIDFFNQTSVYVMAKHWPACIVKNLEEFLENAQSIFFTQEFEGEDGHVFGDLTVTSVDGGECSVRQVLLNSNYVKVVDGPVFLSTLQRAETLNFDPWMNNRGHSTFHITRSEPRKVLETVKPQKLENPHVERVAQEQAQAKVSGWLERNYDENTRDVVTVSALTEESDEEPDGACGLPPRHAQKIMEDDDEMPSLVKSKPPPPPAFIKAKLPPNLNAKRPDGRHSSSPQSSMKSNHKSDVDEEDNVPNMPILITNIPRHIQPKSLAIGGRPPGIPESEPAESEKDWSIKPIASNLVAINSTDQLMLNLREKVEKRKQLAAAQTEPPAPAAPKPLLNLIPHDYASIMTASNAAKGGQLRIPKAKPLPKVEEHEPKKPMKETSSRVSSSSSSGKLDALLRNMNIGKIVQQNKPIRAKNSDDEKDDEITPMTEAYKNLINNEEQLTFNWKVTGRQHDEEG